MAKGGRGGHAAAFYTVAGTNRGTGGPWHYWARHWDTGGTGDAGVRRGCWCRGGRAVRST